MDGVQRLYLDRSIRSLASSTYVEVKGWGYHAILRGLCSDLLSHRVVEFHAREGEKFQPPIIIHNNKFALLLDVFTKPDFPPPVYVDGFVSSWEDCGIVPYSLLENMIIRLHRMSVLCEIPTKHDGMYPVFKIWTAIPVLMGWDEKGRPIFQRPVEEHEEEEKPMDTQEETVV